MGKPIAEARGIIKFEHGTHERKINTDDTVAFAYPTRPLVRIFSDLSFEIAPGTNVSIVGPSGGGKSTISINQLNYTNIGSLLLRFYDPTAGRITLNGTDIREYNVKQVSLRDPLNSSFDGIFLLYRKNPCYSLARWLKISHTENHGRLNKRFWLLHDGQTVISSATFRMAWTPRLVHAVLNSQGDRSRYVDYNSFS